VDDQGAAAVEGRVALADRAGTLAILMVWVCQPEAFQLAMLRLILRHPDAVLIVTVPEMHRELDVAREAYQQYATQAIHRHN